MASAAAMEKAYITEHMRGDVKERKRQVEKTKQRIREETGTIQKQVEYLNKYYKGRKAIDMAKVRNLDKHAENIYNAYHKIRERLEHLIKKDLKDEYELIDIFRDTVRAEAKRRGVTEPKKFLDHIKRKIKGIEDVQIGILIEIKEIEEYWKKIAKKNKLPLFRDRKFDDMDITAPLNKIKEEDLNIIGELDKLIENRTKIVGALV